MALRIWLPLNGDLTNQGLSNVTVINNGATVDNNGKIGKCYSFDGTDDYISLTSTLMYDIIKGGNTPFSIAMWIYRSDATRGILLGDYNLSGAINFNLELSTSHTVRFYWNNSPDLHLSSAILTQSAWNHLAVTYDGLYIKCYINGALKQSSDITLSSKTKTSGPYYIGRDSRTGTTAFNGKMNDVRIYDHVLSAKEVKELAKGLVLHYRLAGPGQENLITTMAAGGRTTLVDKYTLNADFGQNIDTYGYINVKPALELDKIYTLSFDVLNMPAGGRWNWRLWNNANYSFWIEGNGHYSYTFCPSIAKLPNDYNLTKFLFDDGTRTNPAGIVTFTNFKIEEGSIATPWCPHKDDPLYSAIGYNNNIEYDCSGYHRNGTKSGNIIWDIDSPRYTTSYKFGSTSTKIKVTAFGMSGFMNSYSFSWWQKNTSSDNMPWGFSDGNRLNFYHTNNSLCLNTGDGGSNPFKDSSGAAIPNTKLCDSKWHHCVITGNGTSVLLYVDGKLIGTATYYKALTGTQIYLSGFDTRTSYTFNGSNLSDFRIYATTLSAEDIAELYHSAVIVDNTGKSYAYEYFEAN